MKVLLIRPYLKFHPYEYQRQIPEPLGLEYLVAVVREKHEVRILDCVAENWKKLSFVEGYIRLGLSNSEIKERIKTFLPDIVGISCSFSSQSPNTREIADITKEISPDIFTVAGGAHPSAIPKKYLEENPSIDIVVVGEGEITFPELVDTLEKQEDIGKVKGICYRRNNNLILTGARENIKDLDSLPFPARDLVPYKEYSKMHLPDTGIVKRLSNVDVIAKCMYFLVNKRGIQPPLPFSAMITSRGCPNNCYFCAIHSVWGYRYRMRSAKNVVDEIEFLVNTYNVKGILFEDDNISMSKKRMIEICKEIIERGIDIKWECPSGVYLPSLDEEVLQWMKRAGCYRLEFGIESGNQEVLDKIIMKKQDLDYVKKVIQMCHNLDIKMRGFFVLGLPGETKKTMADTLRFALGSGLPAAKLMIAQPWPGSRLYEDVIEKGMVTDDYDYVNLRVRTDEPYIVTTDFSPQDVLAIRNIGNKMLREKNYEKYVDELEQIIEKSSD